MAETTHKQTQEAPRIHCGKCWTAWKKTSPSMSGTACAAVDTASRLAIFFTGGTAYAPKWTSSFSASRFVGGTEYSPVNTFSRTTLSLSVRISVDGAAHTPATRVVWRGRTSNCRDASLPFHCCSLAMLSKYRSLSALMIRSASLL